MGYVATLVINMDALHLIKDDKEFGKSVYYAVSSLDTREGGRVTVGGFHSAAQAIERHHSSQAVTVLVGGHQDKAISGVAVDFTLQENTELEVLKQLAEKHGFSLRKKPVRE